MISGFINGVNSNIRCIEILKLDADYCGVWW